MDHTPFIVGAYSAAFVVLLWCALAPVLRARRFRSEMRRALPAEPAGDEESS